MLAGGKLKGSPNEPKRLKKISVKNFEAENEPQ